MTKKNDKSPEKKPRAKKGEKPAKETAPKARKGKGAEPPPEEPPPPPAPAPAAADDSAEGWMDGKRCLDHLRHLLAGCPKVKDNPALSFVLLAGATGVATDDRLHQKVEFEAPVSETALKVTRASVQSFERLLDGEIKAAAEVEAAVLVQWHGLVAKIRRTGSDEEHTVLLDKHDGGPSPEHMALPAPVFVEGGHVMLDLKLLRDGMVWKGDGTVHLFVAADARQLWMQIHEGDRTAATSVFTFAGGSLGIREPVLPGVDTRPRKPGEAAAATPAGDRPAAVPVAVFQLPAGTGWCRIECNRSAAWDRLPVGDVSDLAPYAVDEARGVVSWGPYPRSVPRVVYILKRLRSLNLDPREVACEAPDLMARALGAGEPSGPPPLQLGDGIIDVAFEETPVAELGPGGGSATAALAPFPSPPAGEPVVIEIPAAIFDDELTDEQVEALRLPGRTSVIVWNVVGDTVLAIGLDAEEARAVSGLLAGWGYRAERVEDAERGGERVQVWTVGRAGESGAAL